MIMIIHCKDLLCNSLHYKPILSNISPIIPRQVSANASVMDYQYLFKLYCSQGIRNNSRVKRVLELNPGVSVNPKTTRKISRCGISDCSRFVI